MKIDTKVHLQINLNGTTVREVNCKEGYRNRKIDSSKTKTDKRNDKTQVHQNERTHGPTKSTT